MARATGAKGASLAKAAWPTRQHPTLIARNAPNRAGRMPCAMANCPEWRAASLSASLSFVKFISSHKRSLGGF